MAPPHAADRLFPPIGTELQHCHIFRHLPKRRPIASGLLRQQKPQVAPPRAKTPENHRSKTSMAIVHGSCIASSVVFK
ncbi:MAG: hypothetical protein J0H80_01370 [Rhizobiales bacterium]|nr:hypothetical protein [Hyphomicrobiales bacterium]MBN9052439.1 hypothetical protein [Hyphomicrobiales bacterium]